MNDIISTWEIEVYTDAKGQASFEAWLFSLDTSVQLRIAARIDRMRDGNFGDSKTIQDGICELRLHFGAGYRIYYGKVGKRIVLLLCGGDKGSQQRDINKALTYWADYKDA
jgi:putative addiction module killer protein